MRSVSHSANGTIQAWAQRSKLISHWNVWPEVKAGMNRLVALACLSLSACGQAANSPTASSSSPQLATATSRTGATHEVLFAADLGQPCGLNCASTVGIVGLDGRIHVKAKFTPPVLPAIGCEGSFVAAPVQVAAGSVYYLDSSNALHRLSVTGDNRIVAKFSVLSSQQITWFAVSPDGAKAIASVVAWTPLVSPTTDPSQGCPQHVPGDVREELELATLGGSMTTLWTKTLSGGVKGPPAALLAVAGWDAIGPVATTDTHMAYIGYVEGTVWLGPAVQSGWAVALPLRRATPGRAVRRSERAPTLAARQSPQGGAHRRHSRRGRTAARLYSGWTTSADGGAERLVPWLGTPNYCAIAWSRPSVSSDRYASRIPSVLAGATHRSAPDRLLSRSASVGAATTLPCPTTAGSRWPRKQR